MPHKHKRKRDDDASNYDLPPTQRAKTLAVHQKADPIFTSDIERKRRRGERKQKKEHQKNQYREDDTPKAFKRLLAFQDGKRIRSGLDDGTAPSKKRRKGDAKSNSTSTSEPTSIAPAQFSAGGHAGPKSNDGAALAADRAPSLKIKPNESLSSFSARVDQSLPLTSVAKHKTKLAQIAGLEKIKTPLSKHNKRLARMQKEWRNTEQKLKAKEEELDDELADKREEDHLVWLGAGVDPSNPLGKKRRKKGAGKDVDDADPWKILEKKRREEGELRQRSLQDVVTAPPVLKPLKNIFKDKSLRVGITGTPGIPTQSA
ncbi:putative urease accessory protein [Cladophialophora carrionii]|uniref:Putative urease accessory protein n=1 Tax=Cladophialophora carrionii TaxID=86049 RepID=A0A1C1C9L6_9EURO|nr:putative urease accessory protein [Cladophialophora carrionii]